MKFLDVQVITPAVAEVVTTQEYIDHARLNGLTVGAEPDLIKRQLDAATHRAELYIRRSLLQQTLRALFVPDGKNCACTLTMPLPRGDVASVTSITSGGEPVSGFRLEWNVIILDAPLRGAAAVEYVSAGYGATAADVPAPIREGILEYATTLYEDRTGAREPKYAAGAGGGTIPRGVQDLWRPFQIEYGG